MKNNTETAARRPRILLNGSYAPSLTNFRGDFIRAMIARGFDVHVSAPDIPAEIRAEVEAYGASVHQSCVDRAGMNIRNDVRYLLEMRRLVKSIQPDIVVGYTIKPNIWGGLAARLTGTASISMVTGLGYAFGESGTNLRGRVIGTLSRCLYRLATSGNKAVIFQNPDDLKDFEAAGCLGDLDKARMINGSGVDVNKFTPTPLADQPIYLLIGRLLKAKGVREYAEAGLRLLGERADCRVQIAGFIDTGPDSIAPSELDHWVEKGVEFLGSLDDVRPALAAATVYVLPSYREGTPRTVLEAMASGRAVITTDAPGCRETVKHGETGLLVPPRDADALYKAMVQLADDPKLRAKFGAAGRKYCEEKYDVAKVNDILIGHLELS